MWVVCVCGGVGGGGEEGLKPVLLARNLAANSDTAPNYKHSSGHICVT